MITYNIKSCVFFYLELNTTLSILYLDLKINNKLNIGKYMENKIRKLINKTISEIGVDFEYTGSESFNDIEYYNYTIIDGGRQYLVSFSSQDSNTRESIIKSLVYGVGSDGYSKGKEDEMDFVVNLITKQKQTELFDVLAL